MSSVIRAPKVTGQPRILAVERTLPVSESSDRVKGSENVRENGNTNAKNANNEADALEVSQYTDKQPSNNRAVDSDDVDELHGNDKELPQTYYSTEIAAQISEMSAKLAASNEELEEFRGAIQEQRDSAQKQGYEEGYKKGLEDADRVVFERLQQLEDLIHSSTQAISDSVRDNEDTLVEVVFAAVTKMLGDILPTKEGAIQAVKQATQYVTRQEEMLFRVSERDYQLLKDNSGRLVTDNDASEVRIVPDQHVELGGCILETSTGSLDSRLEIQLANLIDVLKSVNTKHRMERTIGQE